MKPTTKRHIASWMLLAVFVPMLLLSSLHIHEESTAVAETACTDCVHHNCHGHLTQMTSWIHECVLCQFQLMKMLTAAVMAVTVYIQVCKTFLAQSLCSYHAACCSLIVTRGPPSL